MMPVWSARSCGFALAIRLVTGGNSVMPPPHRRPSRSVKVLGRVSRPVRLGNQSAGSLSPRHSGRPHTGEEVLPGPRGGFTRARRGGDAAPGGIHDDEAAQVEPGPAGASVPGPGPAETGPAD